MPYGCEHVDSLFGTWMQCRADAHFEIEVFDASGTEPGSRTKTCKRHAPDAIAMIVERNQLRSDTVAQIRLLW